MLLRYVLMYIRDAPKDDNSENEDYYFDYEMDTADLVCETKSLFSWLLAKYE